MCVCVCVLFNENGLIGFCDVLRAGLCWREGSMFDDGHIWKKYVYAMNSIIIISIEW